MKALVKPRPETVGLVQSWLDHYDVQPISESTNGDFVTLRVTVEQAERMLGTKYNVYRHDLTSEYIVRTMGYSIPRDVHGHVDVVTPTTYFGTMRSMKATHFLSPNANIIQDDIDFQKDIHKLGNLASVPASCGRTITPSCLRSLYNTASYTVKANATNKLGIVGYLEEFANFADLQTFFQKFRTDATGSNFTTVLVNGGGEDQSQPGTEVISAIHLTLADTLTYSNIGQP